MFKDKRLIPIFIVVFVDILGFSIILPLLPYYAGIFHASDQTIGLLIASYSMCQFVAAPLLGNLSDSHGRRPVLLYSQLGSLAGFILLGVAMNLPQPLAWMFASRMIDGFSGGNLTVAQAYISDITKPEDRAKTFGMIIGGSFGIAFTIGPALGSMLSAKFGYNITAYVSAAISLTSILATLFLLPETQHQRDENRPRGLAMYTRAWDFFSLSELRPLLMIFFFMSLPFTIYTTMFPLFAKKQLDFTVAQAGNFLALVGLLGIFWQAGMIGPFVKKFGEYKSLLFGLTASAIGLYYVVFVNIWWKLIIVALLFSFGHGISRPPLTSIIARTAPPNRKGGVFGALTSLESLTRILGPILGGWIIAVHPTWLGWIGGLFFTIATLIGLSLRTKQPDSITV